MAVPVSSRCRPRAANAIETLAQSGFQAVVVRKGRLWMNSYHVLVGPFD
jgi:hypothetical protein